MATDSRLSNLAARRIADGFDEYERRFNEITLRFPQHFSARDWPAARSDAHARLELYGEVLDAVVDDVSESLGDRVSDPLLWVAVKAVYSNLIRDRDDWELAETFHNSVTRRIFDTVGVDERIEFVDTDFDSPPHPSTEPVYLEFSGQESTHLLLEQVITSFFGASIPPDAVESVSVKTSQALVERGGLPTADRAEVIRYLFYRGQAAYIIGLLYSGSVRIPLVIAFRHGSEGLGVDAVLLNENEVSILFSFTRSHFHVDAPRPYDLVRFLRRLMPRKRIAELYISVGQNKHGKTELYRDLLRHVHSTDERFEYVPGTEGLVMIVFGMPGYDDVFKVIRDSFPPQKKTTRQSIMEKYELVSRTDRAGRLIDAQNFQHLTFDAERFDSILLKELTTKASKTVRLDGDQVVISHMYVERRVIPLDVYVRAAVDSAARAAVLDYGQSIKDLACTNIFPGDLLTKNFGVTRHGRVVFYDYDEIAPLTDIVFRHIPQARDDIEEMSDGAWFSVGPSDVFPEEHRRFLGMPESLATALGSVHGDIFEVEPWRKIQERINGGELIEILPYSPSARIDPEAITPGW